MKKSKVNAKVAPNKWMNSMFEMDRARMRKTAHFTGKASIESALAKTQKELIRKIKLVHAS